MLLKWESIDCLYNLKKYKCNYIENKPKHNDTKNELQKCEIMYKSAS